HSHGQREIVGRILEERILADVDLVEVDPREERREAEGLLVRDEVHFVPALGERDPELGGDGPRAAVRGVAGDPDLHRRLSSPHHASARSMAPGSAGFTWTTCARGSWFRNQVRWR